MFSGNNVNGTNDARYPCIVTLSIYKYFWKRMDPYTPGCRGLFSLNYFILPLWSLKFRNLYTHSPVS